jgi:hypothetical protein
VPPLLALTPSPDGHPRCWGRNSDGQLGRGNTAGIGGAAGEVASLADVDLGPGRTVVQLAAGRFHNCALLQDGQLCVPPPPPPPDWVASGWLERATCVGGPCGAVARGWVLAPPLLPCVARCP